MTFYEAALRVLEDAGKPLTNIEITKASVDKNLLSHVGKTPETTMLARLAAMARRPRDRKVIVTAKDTFALIDWMLPEDTAALALTGVMEPNPEEAMPPYRPVERHPESKPEFARGAGRGERDRERHKRRDEERERKKKYPPIAEVVFEVLSEAEGSTLAPADLMAKARERELISDELSLEQILSALADDNQKRIDAGRRPQFHYSKPAEGAASLKVDAGGETPVAELQQAFCQAAGIPFENGRAVIRRGGGDRDRTAPLAVSALAVEDEGLASAAKHAVRDSKRAIAKLLRQKLADFDVFTFEKSVVRMLHGHGFRELKVAKRSKEGQVLTARRRDGSLELRVAVRVIKGTRPIDRRDVQELRRDLGHYGANLGLICSPGEPRGDAKSEAVQGALVMLWCGEGLADKFFEAHVGVHVQTLELYEIDEDFFTRAQKDAEEARQRREERHQQRAAERPADPSAPSAPATPGEGTPAIAAEAPASGDDDGGDDDEGEEGDEVEAGAASGQPGQPGQPGQEGEGGRRRRRRRRGRRGRGPLPEGGQPGQPGQPGQQLAAGTPAAGTPAPSAIPDAGPTAPTPPAPEPQRDETPRPPPSSEPGPSGA